MLKLRTQYGEMTVMDSGRHIAPDALIQGIRDAVVKDGGEMPHIDKEECRDEHEDTCP